MELSSSFKTLNAINPLPFSFRSRSFPFRPFYLTQFISKHSHSSLSFSKRFSTLCSVCKFTIFYLNCTQTHTYTLTLCLNVFIFYVFFCGLFISFYLVGVADNENGNSLPHGVGEAVSGVSRNKLLQVVLVSPQIPGNTGCIARTCAASAVGLHLVGPLGFQVDSTKLKRAGLDYWPYVVVKVHESWTEFQDYFRQQEGDKRLLAFTKRGTATHSEFLYRKGDYLIFGSETSGLPPEALQDCKNEPFGGGTIRIPMIETYVRCLNLSVSVGIALYEASRQLNYEQLKFPSESWTDNEQSFIIEDIFA